MSFGSTWEEEKEAEIVDINAQDLQELVQVRVVMGFIEVKDQQRQGRARDEETEHGESESGNKKTKRLGGSKV